MKKKGIYLKLRDNNNLKKQKKDKNKMQYK